MIFNYYIGRYLSKTHYKNPKILLSIGIVFNLSLLGYFKYSDFFIMNFNHIFDSEVGLLHLVLPLAISFYTFQQIAYLVDSYRKETKEYDFVTYALFVTFFPQLIAGPIVHHSEMMPQFKAKNNNVKNYNNIALGLFIFSIGLFKKVAIADTFAIWATQGFDVASKLNMLEAWITSLSYTFQLYFDFSGYTDMAIGAALLFNIKLPVNFFSPYKAKNIQDFWHRWHITLSRFLKEYIYIPLGGNRKGEIKTYTNLFVTFLLGGIWHGAGWTFVLWGVLHGGALAIHRLWRSIGLKMPTILAWFITFNFLNITWVFFRATNFESAIKILQSMFLGNLVLPVNISASLELSPVKWSKLFQDEAYLGLFFLVTFIIVLFLKNSIELKNKFSTMAKVPISWYLFSVLILGTSFMILSVQQGSEFLYFNF